MNIEHLCEIQPAAVIAADGRCCGRKPLTYKRRNELFCTRCDRSYDATTLVQKHNFHWIAKRGGFRLSVTAIRSCIVRELLTAAEKGCPVTLDMIDVIMQDATEKGLLS